MRSGRIVPVKLRNRPATSTAKRMPSVKGGIVTGELPVGVSITKAVVVWGNDPQFPSDIDKSSRWFAFPDPRDSKRMVFAHELGFDLDDASFQRLIKIEPEDIQGRLQGRPPKGPGLKISSR